MKIAYLITAYNNYEHLKRLIEALNDNEVVFFLHIDKKSIMPKNLSEFNNLVYIKRIKVWWGAWSHLKAIISLMRESITYNFDYYILISGTDFPIRPNSFLYEKLKNGGEYINLVKGFMSHKPESRMRFYYLDGFDRRNSKSYKTKFFLLIEKVLKKVIIKTTYPFQEVYHGSTWWALSHRSIVYVLNFIDDNPNFVKFYTTCWCPEESFVHTIIGNSKLKNNCKTNLTFTDWSSNPSPALINTEHVELFKKQIEFESTYGLYSPFFARKFEDSSVEVVELIIKELRN